MTRLTQSPAEVTAAAPQKDHPQTATKSVQTEFPSSLLESYVVKNKKRILKLLDIPYDSRMSVGRSLAPPTDKHQNRSWNTMSETRTGDNRNSAADWDQDNSESDPLINNAMHNNAGYDVNRKRFSDGDLGVGNTNKINITHF